MATTEVLVFNPEQNKFTRAQVDVYTDYYKLLSTEKTEVRNFDIVQLTNEIDIYIDDEGLLQNEFYVTVLEDDEENQFQLAGNLVFTGGPDNDGNTTSISKTEDEIRKFIKRTYPAVMK